MVNPERLHNAAAALDILARADSTAFATARTDANPAAEGASAAARSAGIGACPYPMGSPEQRAWLASYQEAYSEGGTNYSNPFRGRGDAGPVKDPMEEHARLTAAAQTAKQHGDVETYQRYMRRCEEIAKGSGRNDAAPTGYTEIWTEDGLDQEIVHTHNYKQLIAREKKDLEKTGCRVRLKHFDAAGKPMARLDDAPAPRNDGDRLRGPQEYSFGYNATFNGKSQHGMVVASTEAAALKEIERRGGVNPKLLSKKLERNDSVPRNDAANTRRLTVNFSKNGRSRSWDVEAASVDAAEELARERFGVDIWITSIR